MKAVLSLSLLVCLAADVMARQASPPQPRATTAQRVASFDELRATTPAELAAAERLHGSDGPLRPAYVTGMPSGTTLVQEPSSPTELLQEKVCSASAIVAGHSTASHVIVDNRHTTLIMADRVSVSAWIRPRQGPMDVEVFTRGGDVVVGDLSYSVADMDDGPWLLSGLPMLLFLRALGPSGYWNHDREMSAPITNGRVKFVGIDGPLDEVIARLRTISAECR